MFGYALYHFKNPFYIGFCFGLGMFGIGVSWIFVSIQFYGGNPFWLSVLITLIFIAFLSLYPAILAYGLKKWIGLHPNLLSVMAAASAWTIFEGARSTWFSGFPWLLVGYSQIDSPLACLAPIIGVYGLSWLVVCLSGGILLAISDIQSRLIPYKSILLFGIGLLTLLGCYHQNWTEPSSDRPVSVALVQGNIAQLEKWDEEYLEGIFQQYMSLSDKHWHNDIVLWPESAIPKPLPYANDMVQLLQEKTSKHQTTLVTGIPFVHQEGYTNSIITVNHEPQQRYDKIHLVPFGEFVPFKSVLYNLIESMGIPMIDFIHGHQTQSPLHVGQFSIAPFICYEIAFDSALLSDRMRQSELMVTVSNDAWFGDSLAPHQHLQIARMRSAQTGRYQLFATNDGITAVIDTKGAIQSKAPIHQSFVLEEKVKTFVGQTPWMRYGHLGLWLWVYFLIALMGLKSVMRKKPPL